MTRPRRALGLIAGVALGAGLAPSPALAQACAMCRSAVQSAGDPLARGINMSVLFMVSMPFAVVGAVGGWLVYTYRRAGRLSRERALAVHATPQQRQETVTLPEVLH